MAAGKSFTAIARSGSAGPRSNAQRCGELIDVVDLSAVRGGLADKQTSAMQIAIAQAVSAMQDVVRATAPKDNSIVAMLLQMLNRRPGPGPTPAPALPPTSTLTR